MDQTVKTLHAYGHLGTELLKLAVGKVSATGETEKSIRYDVIEKEGSTRFRLIGRKYFSAIETGRGPRKSSTDGGFKNHMLKYMEARGIGADLTPKKREQLARFLVYKINKEGDQTFKDGGRIVYSKELQKFIEELKEAVAKTKKDYVLSVIRNEFNRT